MKIGAAAATDFLRVKLHLQGNQRADHCVIRGFVRLLELLDGACALEGILFNDNKVQRELRRDISRTLLKNVSVFGRQYEKATWAIFGLFACLPHLVAGQLMHALAKFQTGAFRSALLVGSCDIASMPQKVRKRMAAQAAYCVYLSLCRLTSDR